MVLIPMMFIAKSWKIVKISKKWNFWRCSFSAWWWLTILKRCKKRIKASRKPPKPVNTRRKQKIHAGNLETVKCGPKLQIFMHLTDYNLHPEKNVTVITGVDDNLLKWTSQISENPNWRNWKFQINLRW